MLNFNTDELREAAWHLGGSPEERLVAAFDAAESTRSTSLTYLLDDPPSRRTVHQPTLASLEHPVVWGAYASLQPAARDRVLDGSADGTDQLAAAVVERFLAKCAVRRNHLLHEDHLQQALRHAAAASVQSAPPHSRADIWETACRPALGIDGSAILYGEALTYGLITVDEPNTWRWRHEFITDWLTRGGA